LDTPPLLKESDMREAAGLTGLLRAQGLVLPKLLKLLSSTFPPGTVWRAVGPDGSPLRKNHVVRAAVYVVAATLSFGVLRSA